MGSGCRQAWPSVAGCSAFLPTGWNPNGEEARDLCGILGNLSCLFRGSGTTILIALMPFRRGAFAPLLGSVVGLIQFAGFVMLTQADQQLRLRRCEGATFLKILTIFSDVGAPAVRLLAPTGYLPFCL